MSDKLDQFMKRNRPQVEGVKSLELPQRKKWIPGMVVAGTIATFVLVFTINRPVFDAYSEVEEAIEIEFEDEVEILDYDITD